MNGWDWRRRMKMKTTILLLSLFLLLPHASAENVTKNAQVSVNITCGMEQCIITGPGLTGFYPNTNSTQSYTMNVPFSYQNLTVQNITIIQNTSNFTIVTQVINVTQCEA